MRFLEFKQTETATKIYAIGDSHAVAVAGTGKFISLATNGRSAMNGANDDAVAKVTPGSTVVLSAGANDMMNPNKQQVASRVVSLITKLQQKDCKVFYILFAETDNPKFAKDRNQLRQLVKSSLPAGVEVIDMGKLSMASGDGIHAPMGWYTSASAKVKAGAKPGQAPTPTPTPTIPVEQSLKAGPPFKSEDKEAVTAMQQSLKKLGYSIGPTGTDGKFGPYTTAALRAFQKDYKLEGDGTAFTKKDSDLLAMVMTNKIARVEPSQQKSRVGKKEAERPVVYDAVTKGKVGEVLNFVAGPESRGYYDMMFGGERDPNILKMTMNDLAKYQLAHAKKAGSSAAGRYQIMHFNTINYARAAGLDPQKEKFTPENQDKMGIVFLKEKGLDQWLSGKISDKNFLEGLARVWAGLPAPSKDGDSYYGGVGLNRSKTSVDIKTALNTLSNIQNA